MSAAAIIRLAVPPTRSAQAPPALGDAVSRPKAKQSGQGSTIRRAGLAQKSSSRRNGALGFASSISVLMSYRKMTVVHSNSEAHKPLYKKVTGRCYCGAIEWQLNGKVNFTSTCHCTDCQAISGSSYGQTALMIYDRASSMAVGIL